MKISDKIYFVCNEIKNKGTQAEFTYFDIKILICLQIAKLEIDINKTISSETLIAINEISVMDARQIYKGIYPDIYNAIVELKKELNPRLLEVLKDREGVVGYTTEKWLQYFNTSLSGLFNDSDTPPR